jgi:sialic acid synthase SpsE
MNKKLAIENSNDNSMVAQLRAIRDKISLEIMNMNKTELKTYFKAKKSLFSQKMKKRSKE